MLPPLPRCRGWAHSSLKLGHPYQPSPIPLSGRPAHRPFRGLLGVHSRCGLHTRAVTKFVTVIRGLQTFRHLDACPGCFRLERSPGGPCTHWKKAPPCLTTHVDSGPSRAGAWATWLRRSRPSRSHPGTGEVRATTALVGAWAPSTVFGRWVITKNMGNPEVSNIREITGKVLRHATFCKRCVV